MGKGHYPEAFGALSGWRNSVALPLQGKYGVGQGYSLSPDESKLLFVLIEAWGLHGAALLFAGPHQCYALDRCRCRWSLKSGYSDERINARNKCFIFFKLHI